MHLETLIAACLLFISPLLSFPFIVWCIYKRYKGGYALFAIFMGLLAYLLPPCGDLYRHTRDYFNMGNMSSKMFTDTLKDDFLVQYIAYNLSKNGIPYQYARLLYTTIEVGILGYLFSNYVTNTESYKKNLLLFITLFGGYNFIVAVLGVRYGLGTSLFLLGYYYLYSRHNILLATSVFGVAAMVHFFFLPLSTLTVILYFSPIRINNRSFLLYASIAIVFGMFLSSLFILKYWNAQAGYLEGKWGTEYLSTVSFKGQVFYYIKRIWVLPSFLFFILHQNGDNREKRIIYAFSLLFLATLGLATISGRIMDVLAFLIVLYFLRNYKECSVKLSRYVLLGSLLYLFSNIYTNRNILFNSHNSHLTEIWKPLPLVLENQYTKAWIFSHVNKDGSLINTNK